ncbi:MAG TPA: hypothetical protein VFS20_07330 [Longimicrobium sp.]|nr:hypothetical protein [Longimicrobium sp.]
MTGYVTAAALEHVDARGRFILPLPWAPDNIPIITPERAREFARAFMRTRGEAHRPMWERQRGGQPLPLGSPELAERMYFAVTPLGRFPDGYHGIHRRMFGPQYLLFFEQHGVFAASDEQPAELRTGADRSPFHPEAPAVPVAVPRRDGYPLKFDEVSI